MDQDPLLDISRLPHAGPLTPEKWQAIQAYLDQWKTQVLADAAKHPVRSFQLGVEQARAFADLIGRLADDVDTGPAMREALGWSDAHLQRELDDALNTYLGRVKDELLHGLRLQVNPTDTAARLYKATRDASINWRTITRTETVRANAAGRIASVRDMGFDRVWVPPHAGACRHCKRLLEGKVFRLQDVENASNYGRRAGEWVPCIPLHPHCRHAWLPYDEAVYRDAMRQYARMAGEGLMDDDRLDAMFDSSGQLRPEYEGVDLTAAKAFDPIRMETPDFDACVEGLAAVVHKARDRAWAASRPAREEDLPASALRIDETYQRDITWGKVYAMARAIARGEDLPPVRVAERPDGTYWIVDGQHRYFAFQVVGDPTIPCIVERSLGWAWEADVCREAMKSILNPLADGPSVPVAKIRAVDPAPLPEQLDPAIWDRLGPRREILDRLERWWQHAVGADVTAATRLYLTPWPDTVHAAVDWSGLRAARPEWAALSDPDLHAALIALAAPAREDVELAPGHPLILAIRPEHTIDAFERGLARHGLQAWSVDGTGFVGRHGPGDVAEALRARADKAIDLELLWPGYVLKTAESEGVYAVRCTPYDALPEDLADRLVDSDDLDTGPTIGWHVAPTAARDAILEHGLIEAQPNERWQRYGAAVEPAGVYVWTDRRRALKWAADMARLVDGADLARNDVWQVDLTGLPLHRDPVLGDQGALYLPVPGIAPTRLTLDVTKAASARQWMTVHDSVDAPGRTIHLSKAKDGTLSLNGLRVDPSRVDVAKGYFDPLQPGLDPRLWQPTGDDPGHPSDFTLRPGVRDRILTWRDRTLGQDASAWTRLFLIGGATSQQWKALRHPERDPDVDVQVIVDYRLLRLARPTWSELSDTELHDELVPILEAGLEGMMVAKGLTLDAFIRPEHTLETFLADAELTRQSAYDIEGDEWKYVREPGGAAVVINGAIMEGVGGRLAAEHPDWISDGHETSDALATLLTAYQADPTEDALTRLQAAYTVLHDARQRAFRPGGGGNEGWGNFVWQYAVTFGPLMDVKHVLAPEPVTA